MNKPFVLRTVCRLICSARLDVDSADFHATDAKVDFMNNERITGIAVS